MFKNVKQLYIALLFTISIFFNIANVLAQTAKMEVDKSTILIGEPIVINVFIQHTTAEVVKLQIPDSIPHFEVISKNNIDTSFGDGTDIFKQQIVITSFDSGEYFFPSLSFNVNGVDDYTDSFKIDVGYMPIDSTATPRDVKNIIEVQYFNWWYIIAVILAIVAILMMYVLYKYINNKKVNLNGVKKVDAYKNAIFALEKMKKEHAYSPLTVKTYHSQLAHIFKQYCSHVMQQNLFINTTNEVIKKLEKYELNATDAGQTNTALQTGDATKFAKYEPSFEENESALQFIKNTIEAIHLSQNKKA